MSLNCLVVENDHLLAAGLSQMLRDAGHNIVCVARNASELATFLGRATPDLIAMDIDLGSGAEGVALATVIQAAGVIPLVFVADEAADENIDRARTIAGSSVLTKPFDAAKLARSIEIALKRASGSPPSEL